MTIKPKTINNGVIDVIVSVICFITLDNTKPTPIIAKATAITAPIPISAFNAILPCLISSPNLANG